MFLTSFFRQKRPDSPGEAINEAGRLSRYGTWRRIAIAAASGLLFTLALPPANLSLLVFVTLVPLLLVIWDRKPHIAAFYGLVWGSSWGLTAFFWLREIEVFIPFLIAPILALWPALWCATASFAFRNLLYPAQVQLEGEDAVRNFHRIPIWRFLFLSFGLAAWFVVLEFSRSTMLPWNNLATAMWRNAFFMNLIPYTGPFGVGLLVAAVNVALALAIKFHRKGRNAARAAALLTAVAVVVLPAAARVANSARPVSETRTVRIGVVQGDISQRRHATREQADEALDVYLNLTGQLLESDSEIDFIVWPESAIPIPYRIDHPTSNRYRLGVALLQRKYRTPMLIGALDFNLELKNRDGSPGITNSALLLDPLSRVTGKYDKIHRVPYGEYVPFRRFVPEFIVRAVDMGRDLTPGSDYSPVEIIPGVRAGIAVCFESVFPYVARGEVRRGANLLLAISNDAWYPTSNEPEQHLANAIYRAAETGLPVLRSGNNGGTLTISPAGRIIDVLETPGIERPEIRRGRGFGVLTLEVPANPVMTVYVRFGEWLIILAAFLTAAMLFESGRTWLKRKQILHEMLKERNES